MKSKEETCNRLTEKILCNVKSIFPDFNLSIYNKLYSRINKTLLEDVFFKDISK